jgi:hypothetical protein
VLNPNTGFESCKSKLAMMKSLDLNLIFRNFLAQEFSNFSSQLYSQTIFCIRFGMYTGQGKFDHENDSLRINLTNSQKLPIQKQENRKINTQNSVS